MRMVLVCLPLGRNTDVFLHITTTLAFAYTCICLSSNDNNIMQHLNQIIHRSKHKNVIFVHKVDILPAAAITTTRVIT